VDLITGASQPPPVGPAPILKSDSRLALIDAPMAHEKMAGPGSQASPRASAFLNRRNAAGWQCLKGQMTIFRGACPALLSIAFRNRCPAEALA